MVNKQCNVWNTEEEKKSFRGTHKQEQGKSESRDACCYCEMSLQHITLSSCQGRKYKEKPAA